MSDIKVFVTSSLTSSERRISPQWSLNYLKSKLELITGIQPEYQTIRYYPKSLTNESLIISDASSYNEEEDKTKFVSHFNIGPYTRLHIDNTDPESKLSELEDEANNDAIFQLSEKEYAKRTDSVLSWKQQNKLGRFDPEFQSQKKLLAEENAIISADWKLGDRCRTVTIQGERRGTIRYLGKIDILDEGEAVWAGIEFDEPVGKNNGSINGVRIFECNDKHGSFMKPKQVQVGDFPELDPFAEESDDEI